MLLEGKIRFVHSVTPVSAAGAQVLCWLQLLPSVPNSSSYSLNGVLESDQYRLLVDQEPELMGPGSGRAEKA